MILPSIPRLPRTDGVMDCGGKAQRRHRYRPHRAVTSKDDRGPHESGVALRFPPQSKTSPAFHRCWRLMGTLFVGDAPNFLMCLERILGVLGTGQPHLNFNVFGSALINTVALAR